MRYIDFRLTEKKKEDEEISCRNETDERILYKSTRTRLPSTSVHKRIRVVHIYIERKERERERGRKNIKKN